MTPVGQDLMTRSVFLSVHDGRYVLDLPSHNLELIPTVIRLMYHGDLTETSPVSDRLFVEWHRGPQAPQTINAGVVICISNRYAKVRL